jgi:hypothetical protein
LSIQLTSKVFNAQARVVDTNTAVNKTFYEMLEWWRKFERQSVRFCITKGNSAKAETYRAAIEEEKEKSQRTLVKTLQKALDSERKTLNPKQITEREAVIDANNEEVEVSDEEVVDAMLRAKTGCVTDRIKTDNYNGNFSYILDFKCKMFRKKKPTDEVKDCVPFDASGNRDPALLAAFNLPEEKKPMVYTPPEVIRLAYKNQDGKDVPAAPIAFKDRHGMRGAVVAIEFHPRLQVDAGPQQLCGFAPELVKVLYLRPWQPLEHAGQGFSSSSSSVRKGSVSSLFAHFRFIILSFYSSTTIHLSQAELNSNLLKPRNPRKKTQTWKLIMRRMRCPIGVSKTRKM